MHCGGDTGTQRTHFFGPGAAYVHHVASAAALSESHAATAVSMLLSDPDQRHRLANQARAVRQRFSEERLRRCFISVVTQLLGDV